MSDEQTRAGAAGHSRRALLAGVGAVGASVVLTACGSDGDVDEGVAGTPGGPAASSPATGGGSTTGGTATGANALGAAADVPVGGGRIYPDQGVVVTQPVAGEFKAFSAICTHQRCPIANVDGGTINCTCHGSKFSIQDGSVKNPPAQSPLPAREVRVEDGTIVLG